VYGGPGSYKSNTEDNQLSFKAIGGTTYRAIEEVRVACYFSQLHNHIHEPCLALFLASKAIDRIDVLFKHTTVPFPLHIRQANVNVNLLLYGPI